jgi:hypothetical protein
METVVILNKTWKVKDLNSTASTETVQNLLSEYKKDPNCRPFDYVAGEAMSDLEKASFINTWFELNIKK